MLDHAYSLSNPIASPSRRTHLKKSGPKKEVSAQVSTSREQAADFNIFEMKPAMLYGKTRRQCSSSF
jgi:hypothetical protein